MEQSSKELVRSLFSLRDLSRIPFIPWVCSFAAQLEQVHVEEMLSDPGLLSSSLLNAQQLFGYDAIVNVFDPSLEAEACGCEVEWGEDESLPKVITHPLEEGATIESLDISNFDKRGRVPTVLEATKRLNIIRGKQVAVVGMATGPLTLARHLRGESLATDFDEGQEEAMKIVGLCANVGLSLCRKYCELGVDAIVMVEETLGQIRPERYQALAGPLKSIWNVTRFYGVHSLLVSRGCGAGRIEPVLALQADGVALGAAVDHDQMKDAAEKHKSCYAVSMPTALLLGEPAQVGSPLRGYLSARRKGIFLSTEWDVPYETDVNTMHEVMNLVKNQ